MESKKINQLATELTPALSDLTIIGDPTTGISKKITLSQMASLFTGTVEEYPNLASFPLVGTADTIYIALDTNIIYRWNTGTSAYVELSPNIVTSLVFSDANGFDGNISLVGSTATLTITTSLTQGSVPFIGASGALSQDNANLFFDDTNNRLGVNTNVPTTALDVFGSGIIGRLNGTSTNNAYLGFASAGTNQWSIGNVQSDHRFRIYSEANTAELVSVLQTGEFGIGIANPLTKLHIFGGASALIANLDANTSVAKSISFRSGNSSRFNIEVSGTESGSNAGMDFQIKRYSDAGSLIDTPFTIYRSTGLGNYAKDFTIVGLPSLGTGSAGDLAYIGDRTTVNTTYLKISRAGGVVTGIPNIASVSGGVGPATLTFSATAFGFNQSDPKSTLHVTDGNITISKSASGSGTVVGSLDFRNDYASPNYVWAQIKAFNGGTHDSSNITFSTWNGFNSLTERMRIVSTGTVGIGVVPASQSGGAYAGSVETAGILRIQGGAGRYFTTGNGLEISSTSIYSYNRDSSVYNTLAINDTISVGGGGGEVKITGAGSSNTAFSIYDVTARRLFCIPSQYYGYILAVSVASNGGKAISIGNAGGSSEVGSIVANASSTTYNTSSDYRLKEDLKDFDGLDILSKIKFYDFKWKSEDARTTGVIAHELQEVVPYAVNGEKDGIGVEGDPSYQGVDYSKLVSIQGRAIQQLQTQIEELKALINK